MGGEINLKQSIIFFHMCMYTHIYIYICFTVLWCGCGCRFRQWRCLGHCWPMHIYIYIHKGKTMQNNLNVDGSFSRYIYIPTQPSLNADKKPAGVRELEWWIQAQESSPACLMMNWVHTHIYIYIIYIYIWYTYIYIKYTSCKKDNAKRTLPYTIYTWNWLWKKWNASQWYTAWPEAWPGRALAMTAWSPGVPRSPGLVGEWITKIINIYIYIYYIYICMPLCTHLRSRRSNQQPPSNHVKSLQESFQLHKQDSSQMPASQDSPNRYIDWLNFIVKWAHFKKTIQQWFEIHHWDNVPMHWVSQTGANHFVPSSSSWGGLRFDHLHLLLVQSFPCLLKNCWDMWLYIPNFVKSRSTTEGWWKHTLYIIHRLHVKNLIKVKPHGL